MGIDTQMLIKTRTPFDAKQVRALSVDLAEAFGPEQFWIWDDYKNDDGTVGRHALELVRIYTQDGDDIVPKPGETFIEVHIATRYYGDGYERGDLPLIIAVACWIEASISDARVYYGGDSSGIEAEPFNAKARAKYWAHFCKVGHKPYRGAGGVFDLPGTRVHCQFCDVDMLSTGGGNDRSFYICPGCDKKVIQHSDGHAEIVPKGKDFFDMRRIPDPDDR